MKKIEAAKNILDIAKESRNKFAVTGTEFDKVQANMYSVFECYAHGVIGWDTTKKYFQESMKKYLSLYEGDMLKEERALMKEEYKRVVVEYKIALDEYKKVNEQKLSNKLLKHVGFIGESAAQAQSKKYYNERALTESELKDTASLSWERVLEAYPNLTTKDEDRVRMLTIFEGPTVDTTQMITTVMKEGPNDNIGRRERAPNGQMTGSTRGFDTDHDYFNPNAGHRDQPSHPENRGLGGRELPDPKTGIYPDELEWEPETSPRPKLRPGSDRSTSPRPKLRPVNEKVGDATAEMIRTTAEKYNVPYHIAMGMADQESGFDNSARGDGGSAIGIFQLRQPAIDDVNRIYGTNFTLADVEDPFVNTDVAMRYYSALKNTYGAEDDRVAVMMYNGGPGILKRGPKAQKMATTHANKVMKKSSNYQITAPGTAAKPQKTTPDRSTSPRPELRPTTTGPDKASIDKAVKQALKFNEPVKTTTKSKVTYQDLARASGIKNANKIYPGDTITLPGGGTYTVKSGDTLSQIAQRYNKGTLGEGYKILPPMDKEKYQERPGLEGPFSTLSGKVVYYDPKEGSYYDPDTDMYMSYDEFRKLDDDYKDMNESARGLGSIDWPDVDEDGDSAMAQHAENAIRHGMHAYDAYDHVYSMSRERDWLSDNKDMIIDMFAQYGLQTEGHSPHPKGSAKYKKHMAAMHAGMDERKMTKAEKAKEERLKDKYDDSDMKASMKKQYGDDWESVYYATIRKQAMEDSHDTNEPVDRAIFQASDYFYSQLEKGEDELRARAEAHDYLKSELRDLGVTHGDSESKKAHGDLEELLINTMNQFDKGMREGRAPDHNMQARMRLMKILNKAIEDSKKKRGIEDEKDRTDETVAGAIAGVAQPLGKMQRRKKTDEAHPNSKVYDKCWDGYEKVPGKKRGEPGSCRKKD